MYISVYLRKIYKKINDEVDKIALPKNTKRWLDGVLFKSNLYLYYAQLKNNYLVSCQHCKNHFHIFYKIKHNQTIKCPSCGKLVMCRNSRYRTNFVDKIKYFSILQKCGYGYVNRSFRVEKINDGINYHYNVNELERCFCNSLFKNKKYFKMYNGRWCLGYYSSMYFSLPLHLPLYNSNLKMLLRNTQFKYSKLDMLAKKISINPIEYLSSFSKMPQLEYLANLKLYTYIIRLISTDDLYPYLDFSLNSINGFLKIKDNLYLKYLLDNKVSLCDVPALQVLEYYKVFPDELTLRFAKAVYDLGYNPYIGDCLKKVGFKSLYNYVVFNLADGDYSGIFRDYLSDYLDYYSDCIYLNLNMNDTMFSKPKDFEVQHRKYSSRVSELKAKAFDDECKNVLNELQKLNYSNKKYSIVVPKTPKDIRDEGNNQCNCVGGYIERIVDGRSIVVFLRRNEDINKSYYTVELNPLNNSIVQCRDYKNRHTGNSAIDKFLKDWINNVVNVEMKLCC